MELIIKKQVEETVNIEFPHYTKNSTAHYCFPVEGKCITVAHSSNGHGIESSSIFPDSFMLEERCTSEEFTIEFNKALSKIKNISQD